MNTSPVAITAERPAMDEFASIFAGALSSACFLDPAQLSALPSPTEGGR